MINYLKGFSCGAKTTKGHAVKRGPNSKGRFYDYAY